MRKQKYSVAAGIMLFALAALFSISLLTVAVDFGGINPAKNSIFYSLGKMLTGVYGLCSVCIPIFLIVAGIQCFIPKWRIRSGVLLIGSIIPFFTLNAVEHICRMIVSTEADAVMTVKLASTLLVGTLILAAEYLLLSILGDVLENSILESIDFAEESGENKFYGEDDESDVMEDEESEPEEESDGEDGNSESDDGKIDLENDKIFLQQKEILKDLINDKNPGGSEADATVSEDATIVPEEPTIVEHEDFYESESIPESVTEDEILDDDAFAEPDEEDATIIEETAQPSPFEHIFDKQEFLEESEDDIAGETAPEQQTSEPILGEFAENPEEKAEPAENDAAPAEPEEASMPVFDEEETADDEFVPDEDDDALIAEMNRVYGGETAINEIIKKAEEPETSKMIRDVALPDFEDEEPPVNSEDFQTEDDALDDVRPVKLDENPADYINIEDISGRADESGANSDEGTMGIDDIFSEMDTDAAENPVLKQQDAPAAHDSPYQTDEDFDDDDFDDEDRSLSEVDGIDSDDEEGEYFDDEYEFEPDAKPVVDANSNPYEDDIPDEEFFEYDDDDDDADEEQIEKQINEIDEINFDEEVDAPDVISDEEIAAADKAQEAEETSLRKLSEYKIPTDLLEKFENDEYWRIDEETQASGEGLKRTLNEFGIEAEVTGIRKGPVVTMFELLPAPGVKLSKIVNLQDNIALSLAAKSVRIVAPIPGKHAVGIEIPNKERAVVSFREIIEQNLPEFKKMAVPVILGKDISGQSQIIDIAKTPHLLIAGATGAGKSVCVNSIILSILYNRSPRDVKLIMVDPKVVELKLYNDIPHLLTPVVTEPKRALQVLQYCICEMERRYALLDGMGVRDIVSYNTRIKERGIATEKLPYIIVIIDEFADLMATSGKELETNVARLTAMSRAVGIHLVLATQRPSVNVITGLIKANIPSRIAFMVASRTDSNIIIDSTGAEKLLGKGDMLYTSAVNPIPTRIQGTLVGDNEVERVVEYVKSYGGPDYIDDEIFIDDDEDGDDEPGLFSDGEDPLYDQALQIVVQAGKASASYIQRRLKIGYNRAARLVEDMEQRGIVGPANGSKPREVIHVP